MSGEFDKEANVAENIESQHIREYIYDMLKQIARLARKCGELFVADAVDMILREIARSKLRET